MTGGWLEADGRVCRKAPGGGAPAAAPARPRSSARSGAAAAASATTSATARSARTRAWRPPGCSVNCVWLRVRFGRTAKGGAAKTQASTRRVASFDAPLDALPSRLWSSGRWRALGPLVPGASSALRAWRGRACSAHAIGRTVRDALVEGRYGPEVALHVHVVIRRSDSRGEFPRRD